jgi:Tol biopolymer transport system component
VPRPMRTVGALAILALLLAACTASSGSPAPSADPDSSEGASIPPSDAAAASASATDPASASQSSGAAPTAERFAPDVISTDAEEYRISFSPDGGTALFARGDGFFPQTRQATIYEVTRDGQGWGEPAVAPFSGEFPDIDPWFSPDGDSVIFSSIRPVDGTSRRDAELFRVDRTESGWSDPVHLASLGSDGDELGASVASDGTIVFASDRTGTSSGWDLYVASPGEGGQFGEPEPIDALNTPGWEFNPAIAADGTALVFTSINRAGGSGLGDLFLAERQGDAWAEFGALRTNSSADEYHASWSADGVELLFVRRGGNGDLFAVPWDDARP